MASPETTTSSRIVDRRQALRFGLAAVGGGALVVACSADDTTA